MEPSQAAVFLIVLLFPFFFFFWQMKDLRQRSQQKGLKRSILPEERLFPALQDEVPKSYDSQVGLVCLFPVLAEATELNPN